MNDTTPPRKVTWLLGTGIAFMPYIFSWITLKQGYSKNAKIASFIWMSVVLLLIGSNNQKSHQEVKLQQHKDLPHAELAAKENPLTPADLIRKWASDIPDDQIRKVCAANSIGAIAFSNELKSGEFISDQKFAEDVLAYPNEIASKYLSTAELLLKTTHNTYVRKQGVYRKMLDTHGLTAFADGANQSCRTALRQTLGR